jgi:hypothetical protein
MMNSRRLDRDSQKRRTARKGQLQNDRQEQDSQNPTAEIGYPGDDSLDLIFQTVIYSSLHLSNNVKKGKKKVAEILIQMSIC